MIIEYIPNTCDINGIDQFGEIMVVLRNGEPCEHWDYSDGAIEFDAVELFLKLAGCDVELKAVNKPSKKLIKLVKTYLEEHYGKVE